MTKQIKTASPPPTQQEFLRASMEEVGMNRREFAELLEVPWDTFRRWLMAEGSDGHREMQPTAWSLVRKAVAYEHLAKQYERARTALKAAQNQLAEKK